MLIVFCYLVLYIYYFFKHSPAFNVQRKKYHNNRRHFYFIAKTEHLFQFSNFILFSFWNLKLHKFFENIKIFSILILHIWRNEKKQFLTVSSITCLVFHSPLVYSKYIWMYFLMHSLISYFMRLLYYSSVKCFLFIFFLARPDSFLFLISV